MYGQAEKIMLKTTTKAMITKNNGKNELKMSLVLAGLKFSSTNFTKVPILSSASFLSDI